MKLVLLRYNCRRGKQFGLLLRWDVDIMSAFDVGCCVDSVAKHLVQINSVQMKFHVMGARNNLVPLRDR